MKLRMLFLFVTTVPLAISLAASDSTDQVLKARRKAFGNCKVYLQEAQQASKWMVEFGPVKLSRETQPVKPSEEMTRLGQNRYSLCRAYESDITMTTMKLLGEMDKLGDKQAQIVKAIIAAPVPLHLDVGATAVKNEKKN
jgi:hypothetical protein